jgi:hypothetical protein
LPHERMLRHASKIVALSTWSDLIWLFGSVFN